MGGNIETISAGTKTELKKKAEQWISKVKRAGLKDIRSGWDPKRVVKTEDGYQIELWAHT